MKTSIDLIAPASAATAERPYVVLKRGLFWRPKDCGYTYNIAEAGRYTREEAEARCHPDNEPVTMELASKYESMKTYTQAELDQHVAAATAKERQARQLAEGELAALRGHLTGIREYVDDYRRNLDRYGPTCRFEGDGMISENIVTELEAIVPKYALQAASIAPAPAGGEALKP